jgi:alkaline phosphatase D
MHLRKLSSIIYGLVLPGLAAAQVLDFVWSGNVTPSSATVVAALKDHRTLITTNQLELQVYDNSAMTGSAAAVVSARVDASSNGIAKLTATGLDPNRQYYYAVRVDGVAEVALNDAFNGTDPYTGRFRTFPPDKAPGSVRYISSTCNHNNRYNYKVFDTVRQEDPLFFICPGDFFYADQAASGYDPDSNTNNWMDSLDEARAWFTRALNATAYSAVSNAAMLRSMPIVYVWDDHDFGYNDAVGTVNPGLTTKQYAHPVYRQYVPHYPLAGDGWTPIYQAFSIGRTRFIITDLHTENTLGGLTNTLLGAAQKAWFKEQLLRASGEYASIVWLTSIPWNEAASPGDESWAGHTAERTEIANFIKENHIRGVCAISGDMHGSAIDSGANTDFATGGGGGFPIFQAGTMSQTPSLKGGPYDHGACSATNQYGLIEVTDYTNKLVTVWTAKNADGATISNTNTTAGYPPAGTLITYTFTNNAPLLTALSPSNGSASVPPAGALVMTFNEPVAKGTGTLYVYEAGGSLLQTVAITSALASVAGNELTVQLPAPLPAGISCYAGLDEGAVVDMESSAFPGIYNPSGMVWKRWAFTTASNGADADADGLPDDWEILHFGGTGLVTGSTPASNGINTMLEAYISNLNPTSAQDRFLISNISADAAQNILTWSASSGRLYTVMYTTNLLPPPSWTALVKTAEGVYTTQPAAAAGYYQLKVRLAP